MRVVEQMAPSQYWIVGIPLHPLFFPSSARERAEAKPPPPRVCTSWLVLRMAPKSCFHSGFVCNHTQFLNCCGFRIFRWLNSLLPVNHWIFKRHIRSGSRTSPKTTQTLPLTILLDFNMAYLLSFPNLFTFFACGLIWFRYACYKNAHPSNHRAPTRYLGLLFWGFGLPAGSWSGACLELLAISTWSFNSWYIWPNYRWSKALYCIIMCLSGIGGTICNAKFFTHHLLLFLHIPDLVRSLPCTPFYLYITRIG